VLTGLKVSSGPITLIGNAVPVRVTCPATADKTCSGTVTFEGQPRFLASSFAGPASKVLRLGRRSFVIPRGRTAAVFVVLSGPAMKAVKRAGKLKVTVVVNARDGAGKRAKPIRRALWLKSEKRGTTGARR
jgi:hypothetical protein